MSNSTMPLAKRTSARQAQRLQNRTQPQARTPRIQAKWVIGGTKSDERKLLEKLVAYLQVDPLRDDDIKILRFLRREWTAMQVTLHTTSTMDALKQTLLDMEVPYLRRVPTGDPRSTSARKWEYWNDYSPEGIKKFLEQQTQTERHGQSRQAVSSQVDESYNVDHEQHSDASENVTETDHSTRKSGTSLRGEENSYRNPIQLLPDSQEIIAEDTEQSPALVDQETRSQGRMHLVNPRPGQDESYSDLPSRRYVDMEQVTAQSTQITSTRTPDRVGMEVDIPKAGLYTPTTLRDPDGETVVDILAMEARNQRRRQESRTVQNITRRLIGQHQEAEPPADVSQMLRQFEGITMASAHTMRS